MQSQSPSAGELQVVDDHKSKPPEGVGGGICQQYQPSNKFMLRLIQAWPRRARPAKGSATVSRGLAASSGDLSVSSVIMKRNLSTRICPPKVPNKRITSSSGHYPVVSFINKGDGLVSLDLMDRVMVNENELYAMSVATTSSSSMHSLSNLSSSFSSKSTRTFSLPPTPPLRNDSLNDCDNKSPEWYLGAICRDATINILHNQPMGSFVVRESASRPGCYALSLRVPKQFQASGVAHYLIIRTTSGNHKIKGFTKEFSSIHSLIVHHSIMQELLPCPLNLSASRKKRLQEQLKCSSSSNNSSDCELPPTRIKKKHHIHANLCDNNDNEVLVDIDSDPDYQRILTQFRKSMANCK